MKIQSKLLSLLCCLMVLSNALYAQSKSSQSIDSLKTILQKTSVDTVKINLLNKISKSYYYNQPKEGIKYAKRALQLSDKKNWREGTAKAYNNLGVCQWVLADYSQAMVYFNKSLSNYLILKNQNGISNSYNNLGLVSVELEKYREAIYYFNIAYKINQTSNNRTFMVYNIDNIAETYYKQKNYTKSLEYYAKSMSLNESANDLNGIANCYTNIGKIYSDQNDYQKGLQYFKKAINNYDNEKKYEIGNTYKEMGVTYYKMALENPKEKKKLLDSSIVDFKKSLILFTEIGTSSMINSGYFELYKSLKEQEDYTEALEYFEKYANLKGSIFLDESKNKITNLESGREIDLKDKRIEIQNLKIKSENRKVYLLVIITIASTIFLFLFFWLYITKRSINYQLKEKNSTILNINNQKDKFFSIIAHDLRGPFNGFLGLTELLAEDLHSMTCDEIKFAAGSMRSSATNLNRLLENLLEWSRMEQGLIPYDPKQYLLEQEIDECLTTIEEKAHSKEIIIHKNIENGISVFADHNILQAVLRNLITNAVKFTPNGGKVSINAKEDNNNTTISIADTGIGMNAKMIQNLFRIDELTNRKGTNEEPSTGLGLILCKEFVEKHGGSIWVESEERKGSTFYFSFPKISSINQIITI